MKLYPLDNLDRHIAALNQPRASGPVPRPVKMTIRSLGISVCLESIEYASRLYCAIRDESGEGASTFPEAFLEQRGTWGRTSPLGRISYNGRVWPTGPWTAEQTPLYDPREAA